MAKSDRSITIRQRSGGPSAMDVIYRRRAVRDFTPEPVSRTMIHTLVMAAVQAPTAMHEEPWVFTVIQDKDVLKMLSDEAKEQAREEAKSGTLPERLRAMLEDPLFNIFYNANTLVVIWAKPKGPFAAADCWLAAENLMLAACAQDLGTCVIGFAVNTLNTPAWRERLSMHQKMTAVAPIILGVPASEPPRVPRAEPEIIQCG